MNCCDEYGNCRQGRDCPVRIERVRQAKERLDADDITTPWWVIVVTLSAICALIVDLYVLFK